MASHGSKACHVRTPEARNFIRISKSNAWVRDASALKLPSQYILAAMICNRCLQRLARRNAGIPSNRSFTTTSSRSSTPVTSATTTTTNPRPDGRPAATSSAAQPFSGQGGPSAAKQDLPTQPAQTKAAVQRAPSSCPAGTVLKGLNFMKNKQDPVALEDHEYPDWLWSVLEPKAGDAASGQGKGDEGDLFCMFYLHPTPLRAMS